MSQMSLAQQAEFQRFAKKTRREQSLDEMDAVMPWAELLALVAPYYSKGETGRKPVGLGIMLRVYFLQQWFALSDPGVEDALYESPVLRRFAGIDLGRAPAPDETTILNFRHLLEEHDLGGRMLDTVNLYLAGRGIRITTGTIVDATIIHAPSSTKNENKERDPEMHQTKKGNQWFFGMKAHIGVDSKEGVVHSVCSTAASVSAVHMLPELLHGDEKKVWGDAGYQGQTEAIHEAAPQAQDMTSRRVKTKAGVDEGEKGKNRTKARVRAKVEWPFRILKRVFGFTKVRYRGLKKNHEWLCAGFALVNLYQNRKRLAKLNQRLAPQGAQCARRRPQAASGGKNKGHRAAQSSVLCRGTDISVPRSHNSVIFRGSLTRVDHRGSGLLRRSAGRGPALARQAGDLCSATSQVVWAYQTPHLRRRQNYGFEPSLPRPHLAVQAQMRSPNFYVENSPTPTPRVSVSDRWLARSLHQDGVSVEAVETALLPGSLCRLIRPADTPRLSSIRYFRHVIEVPTNTRTGELPRMPPPQTVPAEEALPADGRKTTFPDGR